MSADDSDNSVPVEFFLLIFGSALSGGELLNLTEGIGVSQASLGAIGNFLLGAGVGIALFKLSQSTDKSPLAKVLKEE